MLQYNSISTPPSEEFRNNYICATRRGKARHVTVQKKDCDVPFCVFNLSII